MKLCEKINIYNDDELTKDIWYLFETYIDLSLNTLNDDFGYKRDYNI